jgi:flagellar biosynthesis protein FlhF
MIIRRYRGKSLETLRETVVKEMGTSAVIIHSQKVNDAGLVGKLKGSVFEIIAAIEEPIKEGSLNSGSDVAIEEILNSQKNHYMGIRRSMKMLDEKIASIDSRFDQLIKEKANTKFQDDDVADELKSIHQGWHKKVMSRMRKIDNPSDEDFRLALAEFIPTAGGIYFRQTTGSEPDIYALAGPTGVGKTTTLAKMAAQAVLKHKLNVGLITIDTFRVGAVDQLREYASLLGIELAVVFSEKEMKKQIDLFKEKDVILIDTQGRGPFDEEGIRTIKNILKSVPNINTILTVPAGVRKEDAVNIFNNFSMLECSCIIITKKDETCNYDGLTTLFDLADIPIIYITDGQRVPEDIHPASSGLITAMIIPEKKTSKLLTSGENQNARA